MRWKILSKPHAAVNESKNKKLYNEIVGLLLNNRGLTTQKQQKSFLNSSREELDQNFFDKEHLDIALERINKAIKNNERIIVYSDYDVDGITGGAILWETLDALGADVMPYVPNRMDEGYGMSKKGIDNIVSQYPSAKLIITVDHGITAIDQTDYAKEKGLDVIITDHHTVGKDLPSANAIIHTTKLAGSGVAYIFSREINKLFSHTDTKEHLALAAIGTIGDLVPLVGPNRTIAKYGLEILNESKRIGLQALLEVAGLTGRKIGTYEVGFAIAPRINASGRLTHALDALRLLCTKSKKRAHELAVCLNETNLERQSVMSKSSEHAMTLITDERKLLFVVHESYHEGVIGLVAGRLVEKYYRPAIVISKGAVLSKASARSINGFNIVEAIRNSSDLLVNLGGHPMAAGFTVETEKLAALEERLQNHVQETLEDKLLEKELNIDMEIPFDAISKELYMSLQKFAPFGIGNPEPLFATRRATIMDAMTMGNEGQHLKLRLEKNGVGFETVAFGKGHLYKSLLPQDSIDIAYSITENTWNGNSKLQLKIKDIQFE